MRGGGDAARDADALAADGGRRASGVLDANAHTGASVWLRFDNRVPVHSATLDTLSGDGLGERGADATAESGSGGALPFGFVEAVPSMDTFVAILLDAADVRTVRCIASACVIAERYAAALRAATAAKAAGAAHLHRACCELAPAGSAARA